MNLLADHLTATYAKVKDLLVSDPNNKVALDNKIAELETIKDELAKAEFSPEYIYEIVNSINSVSSVLDCYVKSPAARTQNTCSANDLKNSIDNATNAGTCQNPYKGNSEVFDIKGRVAAESNNNGKYIVMKYQNEACAGINYKYALLSEYYDEKGKSIVSIEPVTLAPMNKALEYYKNQLIEITTNNITVKFGYRQDDGHAYGFFDPNDRTINIAINIPGKIISSRLNHSGNLKSTLIHEYYHWLDNKENKPSGTLPRIHAEVVFRQLKHSTITNVTPDKRDELLNGLRRHLTEHWKAGAFEYSHNDEVKERALKVYKPYLKSTFNKDLLWKEVKEGNEVFLEWYYK